MAGNTSKIKSASLFDGIDVSGGITKLTTLTEAVVGDLKSQILNPLTSSTNLLNKGAALLSAKDKLVSGVINDYKTSITGSISGIVGALSGGVLGTGDLADLITVGTDGISVSQDALFSKLGKTIGFNVNSASSLFDSIGNDVIKEFNKVTYGYAGKLVSASGGSLSFSKNWRSAVGTDLLTFLGRGDPLYQTITDVIASNSFYNQLINKSAEYGYTDSFSYLYSQYTNTSDANSAFINSVSVAIDNGDIYTISKILDTIGDNLIVNVNAKYPKLVEDVLSNFTIPEGTEQEDYPKLAKQLFDLFVRIKGEKWYLVNTESFKDTYNLGLVSKVGDDVLNLLYQYEELIPLLACRGMFTSASATTTFISTFSGVPLI